MKDGGIVFNGLYACLLCKLESYIVEEGGDYGEGFKSCDSLNIISQVDVGLWGTRVDEMKWLPNRGTGCLQNTNVISKYNVVGFIVSSRLDLVVTVTAETKLAFIPLPGGKAKNC